MTLSEQARFLAIYRCSGSVGLAAESIGIRRSAAYLADGVEKARTASPKASHARFGTGQVIETARPMRLEATDGPVQPENRRMRCRLRRLCFIRRPWLQNTSRVNCGWCTVS